jgi:hypothetical protein
MNSFTFFWQKIKIIRKKGGFNCKRVKIGQASIVILHRANARNSINEKGNYDEYLAELRQ